MSRKLSLIAIMLLAACGADDEPNPQQPRCMEGVTRCAPADLDAAPDQPVAPQPDMDGVDAAPDDLSSAPDQTDAPDLSDVPDQAPAPDMEQDMAAPDMEVEMGMMGLPDGPSSQRQTMRPLGTTGAPMGFYEYLPPGYGDGTKRPLLLFFHGIGENGAGDAAELPRVLRNGPPKLIKDDRWPSDRPFVVLSTQHSGGGCTTTAEIVGMLNHALATYDIDPRRVYLTGLSCGAIGAWGYLGARRGEVVAAAALIAGDGRGAWGQAGCGLGEVALWGFHGDNDGTVNVEGTRATMNNLIACPQPPREEVKLTIYPGVGHDSWTRTYDGSAGHDIYTWLLSKQKAPPPATLAPGRSIRVDLGADTRTTAAPWNNLTGHTAGAAASRLTDDQGAATGVSVSVTQSFEGANQEGAMTNQAGFPATAGSDTLWTGSFDGHTQALAKKGAVQISGLEPGARYDLTLFASRTGDDGGAGRLTRYIVAGQTRDLEASDNVGQTAAVMNVSADAQGRLVIEVTPSPAGSSRFAYLGVIDLKRR